MTLHTWKCTVGLEPGRPLIAVDPGLHTGVAVAGPDGAVMGMEGGWDETMVQVRDALNMLLPYQPLLVSESFTINANTATNSQAPWSLEAIGVMRFLARRHGAEFKLQMPVEAKKFATNPRLKAQGWYVSTPGGHVNDAFRHLYLAACKTGRLVPPEGVV